MGAQPKQIDALVREQKKALMEQENKDNEPFSKRVDKEAVRTTVTLDLKKQPESLVDEPGTLTPRMCYQEGLTDSSLENLLRKVFDAADEERIGRLQHRDVAELLFACPLSLTRWEFVQLLSAAQEQPGGWIQYEPFLAKIPSLLAILRDRREKLQQRQGLRAEARRRLTLEAVLQLYRDEIDETFRFSKQDAAFIMQTIPGNDRGEVDFEALPTLLQVLRRESVNNAVLEIEGDAIVEELCRSLAEV
ncbi:hypothetical protein Emed_006366 [Eimeria media]